MHQVADIVLPVFGLIVLGFVAGRARWIEGPAIEGLSTFVFNFAIPVLLFRSIATAELPGSVPWGFLVAYYGSTLTLYGLTFGLGRLLLGLNGVESSLFAMSGSYSNIVLVGMPLILASLGDEAHVPLFIVVSTHAAILFLVTTFCAETAAGETEKLSALPWQTARVLLRNSIVVGLVLGLATNLAGLTLPSTLDRMATYLGSAALPCAVFSMGASISRYEIRGDVRKIATAVAIKNLMHPLLVWWVAHSMLGLPPAWTAVAVVFAACPSGINTYLFANRYRAIVASTATVIVVSTTLSILVLSFVLWRLATGAP